jgi:DNA polymerase-3 subunit gamma/tau
MNKKSYIALARKYRPKNFSELAGQEVLSTTLKNAIKSNRLHHAYILTGIRGVGKTSSARIIAKTINCENLIIDEDEIKPCDKCNNCVAITASNHQDVVEIDAASKTGVDDIREIIDSICYAAVMAKYKVYIIDEVHMLSNNAFNALLKTLEEPPAHVKFIFATTEIKKVPITILSRCQRFDLRRLSEDEIIENIDKILISENLSADKEALRLIARVSEGSVRDSLSLLDQAFSMNNFQSPLKLDLVENMLGLVDQNKVFELFNYLILGEVERVIKKFHQIYQFSSDINQLINQLIDINSKITFFKTLSDYQIEGFDKNACDKLVLISKEISLSTLSRIHQMLIKANIELSYSNLAKISFEMILIRICHLVAIPDLKELLLDLNQGKNISDDNYEKIASTIDKKESAKVFSDKAQTSSINQDDIVNEILRNFEGAKII